MKTKTFSNNRVTRSHAARTQEVATDRCHSAESKSEASVSKREKGAILQQVQEIRDGWSQAERQLRAQLGAERRAELCHLLFGMNCG